MFIQRTSKKPSTKRIAANEEILEPEVDEVVDDMGGEGEVVVDPEATDLLFEAEDVAELVAEVTGQTVEVSVEDDSVTFSVGDTDYTVEAEGDEEILEAASNRVLRNKRKVSASTRRVPASRRTAAPARRAADRVVRRK